MKEEIELAEKCRSDSKLFFEEMKEDFIKYLLSWYEEQSTRK